MFRIVSVLLLGYTIWLPSNAQDSIKTQLLDLRTPPSPAFVLLGMEPTSVNKPTEPRAVAASFVSTVRQGGAIEVAPYWLTSHPRLTLRDYYAADVGQTFVQTLSLSFATMPGSESSDSLGTHIGLGARWMFVSGNPRDSLNILLKQLLAVQDKQLDVEDDPQKEAELIEEARELALAIQKENKMRVGFRLEMATAFTMNFLNDDLSRGKADRWGIWLTGAYLLEGQSLDILAVSRLIGNHKEVGTQNLVDFGLRLVSLQNDFSISAEYIHRAEISTSGITQVESGTTGTFYLKNTYRLAGNLEYKYNKDASVYLTFGRNYAPSDGDMEPLLVQVGINFGFGPIPIPK